MTATLSALGGCGDNNNAKSSSGRQPDYYVGTNGIPRLVGGRAAAAVKHSSRVVTSPRSGAVVDQQRRNMNQCGAAASGGISVGTDPVKLNKCLYNLTVRNRNGSRKAESDIAIRSPCSHKSKSSTSGSDNNNNSNSTGTVSSASSSTASASVITTTTGLGNNRRNSVTSPRGSSSIPRSTTTHCVHLGRSANKSGTVVTGSNRISSNGISSGGRSHSTTLLSDRQRRNATGVSDSTRLDDGGYGNSLMRQCRFTVAVRRPPPTSASTDNRLNYQRKYDRSIFGYNRLDQIVLPPLQI